MQQGLVELIREKQARLTELEAEAGKLRRELLEVRQLVVGGPSVTPAEPRKTGNSTEWAESVLRTAQKPLHVNDIISGIEREFQVSVRYATLVGNIARLVKRGKIFERVGPNIFGLRVWNAEREDDIELQRAIWDNALHATEER